MTTAHFDQAAATWDENPMRLAMSKVFADAMAEHVPLRSDWRALEYGCGTGTLSFLLADKLGRITAADASGGMLEQVRRKVAESGVRNLTPRQLDLAEAAPAGETFDFIFSAMVMHHVADVQDLAAKLGALLAPDGWLAIADLCAEDGSFHQDMVVPHNGFAPESLAGVFAAAGLTGLEWRTVHTMERNGRRYPIFLLTGRKAQTFLHSRQNSWHCFAWAQPIPRERGRLACVPCFCGVFSLKKAVSIIRRRAARAPRKDRHFCQKHVTGSALGHPRLQLSRAQAANRPL